LLDLPLAKIIIMLQKALRAFKVRLEAAQAKLRKEGFDYDTIKALAEVAVHRSKEENDDLPMKAIATFSLDEIEADQAPKAASKDLLDLSSPSEKQKSSAAHAAPEAAWDPFSDVASQNGSAAPPTNFTQLSANLAPNPFVSSSTKAGTSSLVDFDLPAPVGELPTNHEISLFCEGKHDSSIYNKVALLNAQFRSFVSQEL
jgi:hypothetical protein